MLLGIDIGTSATKAVIINESGDVLGVGSAAYPVDQPKQGWTEQSAIKWWHAVCDATKQAVAASGNPGADVKAVSFSGQMHGSVFLGQDALDGAGTQEIDAIRPPLLWNDQRTEAECAQIEHAVGGRAPLVELVGNAALTGFTAPKIIWVRENESHHWGKVKAICTPKDYIRLCMTGQLAQDVSDGAGMLLLDVEKRTWNTSLLQALQLDPALFPPLLESAAVAGELTTWAAEQMGLTQGVIVVAGAGDNQAGAVGAGVVEEGQVYASMGTSGVIYAHAPAPRKDTADPKNAGRVHTMCAATGTGPDNPGQWSITGCMLSAAGSLQWARDTLAPGVDFADLLNEAGTVPPGSEGLLFMPHLTGERCPYPNPKARGGWVGLTSRHTRAHMIRSVVEGVTLTMGQILNIVRSLPVPVSSVRLSGGGNKSELWRQMQADIYGAPVVTLNSEEGPAYGGALLAGVGAGVWSSVAQACSQTIKETEVRDPGEDAARYKELAPIQAGLHAQLSKSFEKLSVMN